MAFRGRILCHPGVLIERNLLIPYNISYAKFARHINVSPKFISEFCKGKRDVTLDLAKRLERAIGVIVRDWMHVQNEYNLSKQEFSLYSEIDRLPELVYIAQQCTSNKDISSLPGRIIFR